MPSDLFVNTNHSSHEIHVLPCFFIRYVLTDCGDKDMSPPDFNLHFQAVSVVYLLQLILAYQPSVKYHISNNCLGKLDQINEAEYIYTYNVRRVKTYWDTWLP